MTKKRKPNASNICSQCRQPAVINVLRSRVYEDGDVIILNVPMTYCENCSEELITDETMGMIEQILADPDRYAVSKRVAVADFSAAQKASRRRAA